MKHEPQIRNLSKREIEQVSGAMTCSAALGVAQAYITHSMVLRAVGAGPVESASMSGKATGIIHGACK